MNDDYIDSLKYRNEIEAFSRLKGDTKPDLYNSDVNDKVVSALNEVYHISPDLSLDNPGNMFNMLKNKPDSMINKCAANNEATALNDVADNNYNCSNISWDEYFMNIAILASLRSKDTTKVGSVLVLNRKLVGMGYNGFPSGIDESKLPTSRDGDFSDVKYAYTVHSEQNCILNSSVYDITGATLYVTLFPCNECVKLIIQKKIKEIVYLSDKHHDDPPYVASRRLLSLTDIVIRQYNGDILVKN